MIELYRSRAGDPEAAARVKGWAAELFGLGDDVTVMVTELRCTEDGCPPLETVIAVLGSGPLRRQHKLHKALADVTRDDVAALAAAGTHCTRTGD